MDNNLLTLIRRVKSAKEVSIEIPGLKKPLYPHQNQGVAFLHASPRSCLFDQTGLGKTAQILALLQKLRTRALVFVPGYIADQWAEAAQEFTQLTSVIIDGPRPTRARRYKEALKRDLVIMSYGKLIQDLEAISRLPHEAVVFDEVTYIAHDDAKTYSYARWAARGKERAHVLTATPISRRDMTEVRNLCRVIGVPLFEDAEEFLSRYCVWRDIKIRTRNGREITRRLITDSKNIEEAERLLYPYYIRRTKLEVHKNFPPLLPEFYRVPQTKRQKELCRQIDDLRLALIGEEPKDIDKISRYHYKTQALDSPWLLGDGEPKESPKADLVCKLLKNDLCNEKVVIYTFYLKMHDLLRERLRHSGIPFVNFTGEANLSDHQLHLNKQEFIRNPRTQVFLMSLKGEVGLDGLQSVCCNIIFVDLLFNPSRVHQLAGRLHRMGQENPVTAHFILAEDSCEEDILEILSEKQGTPDRFFNEGEGHLFTERELEKELDAHG